MKKYLLDTNICIFYLKGRFDLNKQIGEIGAQNCFISEITVAELKYGIENSATPDSLREIINAFIPKFLVVPIYDALDIYAKEKVRLRKNGMLIDDFDILIGATAIAHDMIMVTNNTAHFNRLEGLIIEDWTLATR